MAGAFDRVLKLRVLPPLIRALTRLLAATWRYRVSGGARLRGLVAGGGRLVGLTFHGRQPCVSAFFARPGFGPWTILCSRSLDGEMQHRILSGLGHRTVRGSSGRGAARALVDLVRAQRGGHVRIALAVDGSRGPCYRVKPGALALAAKTGALLVPLGAAASRALILARTWDRMHIPRPGARVALVVGRPIAIPPGLAGAALERMRVRLEDLMQALRHRAEALVRSRDV